MMILIQIPFAKIEEAWKHFVSPQNDFQMEDYLQDISTYNNKNQMLKPSKGAFQRYNCGYFLMWEEVNSEIYNRVVE